MWNQRRIPIFVHNKKGLQHNMTVEKIINPYQNFTTNIRTLNVYHKNTKKIILKKSKRKNEAQAQQQVIYLNACSSGQWNINPDAHKNDTLESNITWDRRYTFVARQKFHVQRIDTTKKKKDRKWTFDTKLVM